MISLTKMRYILMKSPKKYNIEIKTIKDIKLNTKKNVDKNDINYSKYFWSMIK